MNRNWLRCGALALGTVLLGGCSAIHYSACGWEVMLSGGMSPSCQAQVFGHKAAKPASSLPSPVRKTGFSIQPPRGAGWYVARNTQTAIAVARRGKNADESYVVYAQDFKLPDLATLRAFQQFVDKGRDANTDPERFTVLTNEETLLENGPQGALCLSYQTTAVDHEASTAKGTETLHMSNAALACRSPYDSHLGVMLVYSYRYHPENADATLPSKLNALISTLRFEPVPNGQAVEDNK